MCAEAGQAAAVRVADAADIQPTSTWRAGEKLFIVAEIDDEVVVYVPTESLEEEYRLTIDAFLAEFELEEAAQTPHELMLEIAEQSEEIEPMQDPDYWLDKVRGVVALGDDALRGLIEDILSAGHAAGKLEAIGKKFALDQQWIEDVRKQLGLDADV